jgi:hypothetical protein
VHGFGGVFGTLCVALFGKEEFLMHGRGTQLVVQIFGIIVCFVFTVGVSYLIFLLIKSTIGLRLSPNEEVDGAIFGAQVQSMELDELPEQTVSQVSVRVGERAYNLFKVDEYLNLPRETRINLIKNEGVQYLDDSGNVVPTLKAVRYLSGIIEEQRDKSTTSVDLVELSFYKDKMDVIGNMQDVLLGEEHSITSVFEDSFLLLKPKGKVSSGFYWHGKEKGYNIAIAATSQDPDISSAFITALTISQLNEIVGIKKILAPEKVLEILDQKLTMALGQSKADEEVRKGVEIGMLLVDTVRRRVYYSGSGSGVKLYAKKLDSILTEFKGLDVPLGMSGKAQKKFERVKIDYSKGDAFFLCTEGFPNQLNESGKRYSTTKFRVLLEKGAGKSMADQKINITTELESWKGKEDQTEDILVMGIKP